MEVEVIDKKNDYMERRFDDPIPTFIPLSHQPSEPLLNHHTIEDYHPSMNYVSGTHQQESKISHQTRPTWDQVKSEIQHAMKGM
jgi:hypothetical protein